MFHEEGNAFTWFVRHHLVNSATRSDCNKKQLRFPDYKHDKQTKRKKWPVTLQYSCDLSFPGEPDFCARVKADKQRHKRLHMFQPSAAPVLICYLASSWLVIFRPQVEPSTSA